MNGVINLINGLSTTVEKRDYRSRALLRDRTAVEVPVGVQPTQAFPVLRLSLLHLKFRASILLLEAFLSSKFCERANDPTVTHNAASSLLISLK